jgi:hypothetical protein
MANRSVAWAEWDEELLGLELSELQAMSFDLGMTGFDEVTFLLTSVTYTHPTQKPVALAAEAILNSSRAGATVLDLFGGSGSTLIACEKTGRQG